MAFEGFPTDAVRFLVELEKHNNRPWFQANKPRYEQSVREPAIAFIEAMAAPLEKISKHFYADPSPMGGSLIRIYRDTRFASDKQPYKTNIGIQFRHVRAGDVHAPGFYLHLDAKEFYVACGTWRPDSEPLAAIRTHIAEWPDKWLAVGQDRKFKKVWGNVTGDRLKKPPRSYDADDPCIEDIKLKDFLGVADLPRAEMHSPDLVKLAAKAYSAASPLMKFLCDALALPF